MATNTKTVEAWKNFVTRYYDEESYAEQAHANPAEMLREAGVPVPEGKSVNLLRNTADEVHVVMPAAFPAELDDNALEKVVAGFVSEDCTSGGADPNITSGPYLGIPIPQL